MLAPKHVVSSGFSVLGTLTLAGAVHKVSVFVRKLAVKRHGPLVSVLHSGNYRKAVASFNRVRK
jgi:hypothetical protein